ncbi:sulfotransferase family 2 domain-containing protein [Demequina litorisediminis]|uniref:Sulfotransferase family protein n=1 Tax=Demequina litorisediminis TaxID=1849022 RepID=A0ABQ6II35_9MICO|nr:sulfotransferase family 2 domain-containing protein [Demequina litorisediminis]GMA36374.1 hypothetical protein GCM10025876_25780 [Demequina litorisediminis]
MPVLRKDGVALLFVHIPKTGGGSVETAFRKGGWKVNHFDGTSGPDSMNHLRRHSPQHADASHIEATFRLERFDGIFTFVRDPLPRLRSEYLWRHRDDDRIDTSGRAFERWLRSTFRKQMKNPWLYDNHIRPQVDFLVRGGLTLRVEDGIDEGLARLANVTGLSVPTSAPRRHSGADVSAVKPSDVTITDKARSLVADFYAEDYRRLGYSPTDASA